MITNVGCIAFTISIISNKIYHICSLIIDTDSQQSSQVRRDITDKTKREQSLSLISLSVLNKLSFDE